MPPSSQTADLTPLAVIIMGVSGSGKSTLGTLLAQALDCSFLEGDDFHAPGAVAKMRAGEPLTDDDRWPWLDRVGYAIDGVVASGGGVVAACSALRRCYRDHLRAAIRAPTRFIFLDASFNELQRRLDQRDSHYMPASLLRSQLATLEVPEADERVLTLAAGAPAQQLCSAALAWLRAEVRSPDRALRPSGH